MDVYLYFHKMNGWILKQNWKHFHYQIETREILLSGATECEIDKQGRFLIPANLREVAKLEKDAVIVGVGTRLEIWDKEIWQKCDENISADEIAENMTMLGI